MEMTLEQYIANPMGKNNAVMNANARELQRKIYTNKLDNILVREMGTIKYTLYIDKQRNQYWAHIKVPSEVCKKFYYDVLLKFYADESVEEAGENLFKYKVKFFSNDPAFVFTYAYVFLNNGIFIDELRSKMSKEAKKNPPKEKNTNENIGYVKSLFFAYLIMQRRGLNKLAKFKAEAQPLNPKKILQEVEDADKKVAARQEEGKKYSSKKKILINDKTAKNMARQVGFDPLESNSTVTRTTKKVKTIKSADMVNKSSIIKPSRSSKKK